MAQDEAAAGFEARIVATCVRLYGERLRGILLFGSRVAGGARGDSDWDGGVWLHGPLRRRDTWLPWVEVFGVWSETLDPTFFTEASLRNPPGWLLEAANAGLRIIHDPEGALARSVEQMRRDIRT